MTTTNTTEVERVSDERLAEFYDNEISVMEFSDKLDERFKKIHEAQRKNEKDFQRKHREKCEQQSRQLHTDRASALKELQHLRSSHSALVEENVEYKKALTGIIGEAQEIPEIEDSDAYGLADYCIFTAKSVLAKHKEGRPD